MFVWLKLLQSFTATLLPGRGSAPISPGLSFSAFDESGRSALRSEDQGIFRTRSGYPLSVLFHCILKTQFFNFSLFPTLPRSLVFSGPNFFHHALGPFNHPGTSGIRR